MSSDESGDPKPPGDDAGKRPEPGEGRWPSTERLPYDAGRPPDELELALAEHRPHTFAAAALFSLGLVAGLAMAAAGIDLLALLGLENVEDLLPEDATLTVWFIFWNNTRVYFLLLVGTLSLGLLTVFLLGFNGVVIGWVVGLVAGEVGVGRVLVLLVPHGIFELPAFWLAGGIALRLVHLAANRVRGARDQLLTRPEAARVVALVVLGWALVGIAAVVEVYVTPAIAETIYGDLNPSVG